MRDFIQYLHAQVQDVFISFLFPLFSFPTPHLCSCFQRCVLISLACVCYIIVEPSHIHSLFGHGHIWGVAYCLLGLKFALESRTSESLSVSLSLSVYYSHAHSQICVNIHHFWLFFSWIARKKSNKVRIVRHIMHRIHNTAWTCSVFIDSNVCSKHWEKETLRLS